jgi:hypothetical protein
MLKIKPIKSYQMGSSLLGLNPLLPFWRKTGQRGNLDTLFNNNIYNRISSLLRQELINA